MAGGCSTLLIMGLIGFFLVYKAIGPLREAGWHFLTTFEWIPDGIEGQSPPLFGIGAMLLGTLISAAIAAWRCPPPASAWRCSADDGSRPRRDIGPTSALRPIAAT